MKTIAVSEGKSMRNYPRQFQLSGQAFNNVRCRITLWAAQKVEHEWHSLGKLISQQTPLGDCHCQILERFALPCKHLLERAFLRSERIPLTLIHPRYWLQGPSDFAQDWQPHYPDNDDQVDNIEDFGRAQAQSQDQSQLTSLQQLSEVRQKLNPEMQHRLDQQTDLSLHRLLQSGTAKLAEQAIPLGLPNVVPKHKGRKKRVVGGFRIETGLEAAERTAKLRERALNKALTKKPMFKPKATGPTMTEQQVKIASLIASPSHLVSEDDELTAHPTTPPTSAQLSHKRSHSIMVDRTPTKPAQTPMPTPTKPAQAPMPTPPALTPASTSATLTNKEDNYELPSSTAPAAVGRRRTTNKVNSQQDWRAILIPKKRGGKK